MAGKLKTNKSIAKRIKVTKNKKIVHEKAGVSHLLTNKNKAHRQSKSGRLLSQTQARRINNLLPY